MVSSRFSIIIPCFNEEKHITVCLDSVFSKGQGSKRSQLKKPVRDGLTSEIGGKVLLPEFYLLFAENMKDE